MLKVMHFVAAPREKFHIFPQTRTWQPITTCRPPHSHSTQGSVTELNSGTDKTNLDPGVSFDLWELELLVVGVHLADLFPGRRAEDLDDLDELVDAGVSGEDRLAQQQLRHHAARGPHVYGRSGKVTSLSITQLSRFPRLRGCLAILLSW